MSVRIAIIFFFLNAHAAFGKSEHVKCLGSEKLHFVVAEGAPLFQWKPGGSLLSGTVAGTNSVIVIARVYETLGCCSVY